MDRVVEFAFFGCDMGRGWLAVVVSLFGLFVTDTFTWQDDDGEEGVFGELAGGVLEVWSGDSVEQGGRGVGFIEWEGILLGLAVSKRVEELV